jgi:hypothetical protein
MRREKKMRNRVDLIGCLLQERKERNREERSVFNFWKDQNILTLRKLIYNFIIIEFNFVMKLMHFNFNFTSLRN